MLGAPLEYRVAVAAGAVEAAAAVAAANLTEWRKQQRLRRLFQMAQLLCHCQR